MKHQQDIIVLWSGSRDGFLLPPGLAAGEGGELAFTAGFQRTNAELISM